YRNAVRRKLTAYHRYIQVCLVAQGLMLCIAALAPKLVWAHFGSWLRTVRQPSAPSEFVVAAALRFSLGDFLAAAPAKRKLALFLRSIVDFSRSEGARLAA
ncbi:MAG: IS4 family transposase, partial [Opitutaceae bacterium]